ncbi:hypothetical protein FACS1894200_11690 [Spirochaetia bacterium]|nr:hypothetical protein FACS1894200_11690 [Spirochaetia bacterium]
MILLLPFYVLKLREKVKQAQTSEERQRLSEELKEIALELETIIKQSEKEGILTPDDRRLMQDFMARLTDYLYNKYREFREVRKMMQNTLLTYAEEAAIEAEKRTNKKWEKEREKERETWLGEQEKWLGKQETLQAQLQKEQARIQELETKLRKYEGLSG